MQTCALRHRKQHIVKTDDSTSAALKLEGGLHERDAQKEEKMERWREKRGDGKHWLQLKR